MSSPHHPERDTEWSTEDETLTREQVCELLFPGEDMSNPHRQAFLDGLFHRGGPTRETVDRFLKRLELES